MLQILTPEPREGFEALVIAKDQPEYRPLPANTDGQMVETKWGLTWKQRLTILWHGTLYLNVLTFGRPLQPLRLTITRERNLYESK